MDTRLDDKAAMVALQVQLWPVMVRSFYVAGYHCLGDLRWVPNLADCFHATASSRRERGFTDRPHP